MTDFFRALGIELLWGVSFLRSVVAVVLGYAVFAVSGGLLFKVAGRDPHAVQELWFVVLAVIYGMVLSKFLCWDSIKTDFHSHSCGWQYTKIRLCISLQIP